MEISRKTDYALRMLAALVSDPDGIISVRTAAKENNIPYSFARSIQHDLALAGIVENSRGAAGGMRLAVAVQGPIIVSGCATALDGTEPCPRRGACRFTSVWCNAERMLRRLFSSVTLHELVVERRSPVFRGTFELVDEGAARDAAHIEGAA